MLPHGLPHAQFAHTGYPPNNIATESNAANPIESIANERSGQGRGTDRSRRGTRGTRGTRLAKDVLAVRGRGTRDARHIGTGVSRGGTLSTLKRIEAIFPAALSTMQPAAPPICSTHSPSMHSERCSILGIDKGSNYGEDEEVGSPQEQSEIGLRIQNGGSVGSGGGNADGSPDGMVQFEMVAEKAVGTDISGTVAGTAGEMADGTEVGEQVGIGIGMQLGPQTKNGEETPVVDVPALQNARKKPRGRTAYPKEELPFGTAEVERNDLNNQLHGTLVKGMGHLKSKGGVRSLLITWDERIPGSKFVFTGSKGSSFIVKALGLMEARQQYVVSLGTLRGNQPCGMFLTSLQTLLGTTSPSHHQYICPQYTKAPQHWRSSRSLSYST